MLYSITFQERPAAGARPIDDGRDLAIDANDKNSFVVVPNVGDFVQMIAVGADVPAFQGKVEGRLFRYYLTADGKDACHVNVIVASFEEMPDLIKE